MKCSNCSFENQNGAIYCSHCGIPLVNICPSCKYENPPEFIFCGKCGAKLSHTSVDVTVETSIKGENRILTIMFVDISGSVPIIGKMLPEEAAELINTCLEVIVDCVTRSGGKSIRYVGDCVLAFFGVPILHEDDPRRAILSALEIQSAIHNLSLDVSIGINTGMVYVGAMGPDIHREFTAIGSVINLASRLQSSAKPGQIIVGESTYNQTALSFNFNPLDPMKLKGIDEPVRAYEVINAYEKPEKIRGIEGFKSTMIGRESELSILKASVNELLSGNGSIISVIGEAGVGKTRLITELKSYLGDDILYLEGVCDPTRQTISYSVFSDIIKNYVNIYGNPDAETIEKEITSKIGSLFTEIWDEVKPYVYNLLTIKINDSMLETLPPEWIRYRTLYILRDLFISLARKKPLILIFDDMHWSDDQSLSLLYLMMDEIENSPIMMICIYRPDNQCEEIGTIASGKCPDVYKEIRIRELSKHNARYMIESLLPGNEITEKLKSQILQKADGNPFFLEEIAKSLIDSKVIYEHSGKWFSRLDIDNIVLPDTIQIVIMNRVTMLDESIKKILQLASAIGNSFKYSILKFIAYNDQNLDDHIKQLEDKSFIYRDHDIPEIVYKFKHIIIQETLYNNLLMRDRISLHQKIGEAIESISQNNLEEFYEELAWHYSRSRQTGKAIEYLINAGKKSKKIYANQPAIDYFRKAISFIQTQPESTQRYSQEADVRELLGDALFTIGSHIEGESELTYALNLISKQDDPERLSAMFSKLADMVHWQSDFDRAIMIAQLGLSKLNDQINCPSAIDLVEVICRSYWARKDWEQARFYADKIAKIMDNIEYYDSIYKAYYCLFWVNMNSGNYQKAALSLEEMEKCCKAHNNETGLARCYHGFGDLLRGQNDLKCAIQYFEKSLYYYERIGEAHGLLEGHLELAHLLILTDDDQEKIYEHIQQGLRIAESMGGSYLVAPLSGLCNAIANAYVEKGDEDHALIYFQHSVKYGTKDNYILPYSLGRIEHIYAKKGQHQKFFEFCNQIHHQTSPFLYWYLKSASPSKDFGDLAWHDEFENSILKEEWQWINPDGKSKYNFPKKGVIEIQTPIGHDLFTKNPNTGHLIYQTSGNFAVETKLIDISEKNCQTGGIFLQSAQNVLIGIEKRLYSAELNLKMRRKDQINIIGRGWLPGNQVYLRLERKGEKVIALCSADGIIWQTCGEAMFPKSDPIWIGLYASAPIMFRCPFNESFVRFEGISLWR